MEISSRTALFVLQRSLPYSFLENTAKIGHAAESALVADLANRDVLLFKHIFCEQNASFQDVIHHRHTHVLLKTAAKMVFADMNGGADIVYGDLVENVFVYVVDCTAERARNRGCTVSRIILDKSKKLDKSMNLTSLFMMRIGRRGNLEKNVLQARSLFFLYLGVNHGIPSESRKITAVRDKRDNSAKKLRREENLRTIVNRRITRHSVVIFPCTDKAKHTALYGIDVLSANYASAV